MAIARTSSSRARPYTCVRVIENAKRLDLPVEARQAVRVRQHQ
jgi:hypothetical protein